MEPRDESKIPTQPNRAVGRDAQAPAPTPGAAAPTREGRREPRRIGRYQVVGWQVAVGVAALLAPAVALLGQTAPWGAWWMWALRVLLLGVAGYCGYRTWHTYPTDPPKPKHRPPPEPTRQVIALPRPAEPPEQIVRPALLCRVCGAPLASREDQELGVDNTCYVQHGARRRYMVNPAHARWQEEMRQVLARQRDEQALADARHARELEDWRAAREHDAAQLQRNREQWQLDCAAREVFRRSPDGRALIDRAHTWGAATAGAVGLTVLSLL